MLLSLHFFISKGRFSISMGLTAIKWSNGKGNNMMEEQAKEELEILEDQYPNQYEFLKQELRTFILELQNSKHQESELLPQNNHCNTSLALLLDTEESTNLEQMKRSDCGGAELELAADRVVMQGKVDESSELETPKAFEAESTKLEQMKRSNCGGAELGLAADRVVMQGKVDERSELETPKAVEMEHFSSRKNKRKDRVDLVLERAQNCLKKLQQLKASLLSPS